MAWNPMHANGHDRINDISIHCAKRDIIGLIGTKKKLPADFQGNHIYEETFHHIVVHVGWRRSAKNSNKCIKMTDICQTIQNYLENIQMQV